MKILHFTHDFFPEGNGGVESYVRDVILAQRDEGIDARLVTGSLAHWPEPGVEELELEGIPSWRVHRDDLYFDHFAKLYHPSVERIVRELLERERPDVVHVHQWIRLTCNLVEIASALGIPAVITLHDLYTSCPRCFRVRPDDEACFRPLSIESCLDCVPRFGHESEREVKASIELFRDQWQSELSTAKAVLAASAATADLIATSTGLSRAVIELLPLAYRPRFEGGAPRPVPPPRRGETFRFGYWGNLTVRKGVPVLLDAFRAVCEDGPARPVELHLFGGVDTPELDRSLRARAEGLPVTFHGRFEFEDLAAAGLHCAVFPMVCFETYGFVLDESFELGLPSIVTDIGAIPVRAGEAALRVPPRDAPAMADAMRKFLAMPELCQELRANMPGLGMSTTDHVARLRAIYERARGGPFEEPDRSDLATRRAELLLLQRESAQARICPEGGPR